MCVSMGLYPQRFEEGVRSPGTGVKSGCQSPEMDAGSQMQVVQKGSKLSLQPCFSFLTKVGF